MTKGDMREGNREVLERRFPRLLERVAAADLPRDHETSVGEGGRPCATVGGVPLQHPHRPREDARRWASAAVEKLERVGARRAIVVGLGLGDHVEALLERFDGAVTVVEPDAGILRLALSLRDLESVLERVELVGPGEDPAPSLDRTRVLPWAPLLLLPGAAHREAVERCRALAARSAPRLRVLVVSPMYGGSLPLASHACRALVRLGHDAELLDLSAFHGAYRDIGRFGVRETRRRRTEALYCEALGDGVAARVEETGADLVLALAQAPLGEGALRAIERAGALRALWFVEDHRLFTYWRDVAPFYDYVFAIQRDECLTQLREAGAGHAAYLPCACDPEVHRPLEIDARDAATYGSDVSFVGAGYRNRREAFRRFLDLDFRLWGSDWEGAGELRRVLERDGARIGTEEAVRIWNATRVNLNLHSSTYCDGVEPRGDFVNPRTFELAASGAFQIVDRRTLLPELFSDDEIVAVDGVAEMKEATEHFLAHPEERRAIAARARRRALADHTFDQRMEALVTTVVSREQDRLAARPRAWTVADAQAEAGSILGDFLGRLPQRTPFALSDIVRTIPDRQGPLEESEAIFLFLQQFDELYLTEHRR